MNAQTDPRNVVPVQSKVTWAGNHLGALLIDSGQITPDDAEQVLRYSKQHGVRFGEAAVRLGLVSAEAVDRAVAQQFDYPYLVAGESSVSREVVAAYAPFSRHVESFRALRSQLLVRWFDAADRKILAIVGPGRADGRSYLTANLAVAFSQLGERTLLIDADLRHPRQHQIFGLGNGVGLSTVLAGRADFNVAQRVPALKALSVLTAGPMPPNPQELLNREGFQQLLDSASQTFDVVLIDTAAASLFADAAAVAVRSRGAVLVARTGKTKLSQLRSLAHNLASAGVAMIGSVANQR